MYTSLTIVSHDRTNILTQRSNQKVQMGFEPTTYWLAGAYLTARPLGSVELTTNRLIGGKLTIRPLGFDQE